MTFFRAALLGLLTAHTQGSPMCEGGQCKASLRPTDLPGDSVFKDYRRNHTVSLKMGNVKVAEGVIDWEQMKGVQSNFAILPGVMRPEEARAILSLMNKSDAELPFDADPDSVDGFASHEMFIDDADGLKGNNGKLNAHPSRIKLREQVRAIMQPILDERITPYVRHRFPECDRSSKRKCKACYSLVRRYKPLERRSHPPHYDAHALVTVVTSLTDFGSEYTGGLYVATGRAQRQVVALARGDAVVHQGDLLHGVHVSSGERWSWILWFRDSETCEEHGHEWHKDCSDSGDPICQMVHANKVGSTPGMEPSEVAKQVLELNMKAAEGGLGGAMFKIGRAYIKRLPSSLPHDPATAARWFRRAIKEWACPDSHYSLAQMIIDGVAQPETDVEHPIAEAVAHFEAAALAHHVFAMYNLGVAHLYGFGVPRRDPELAYEWFLKCGKAGLPEGLYAASLHHKGAGRLAEAQELHDQATRLGFGQPWRKAARDHTGSGGVGNMDLHSMWPHSGKPKPPEW